MHRLGIAPSFARFCAMASFLGLGCSSLKDGATSEGVSDSGVVLDARAEDEGGRRGTDSDASDDGGTTIDGARRDATAGDGSTPKRVFVTNDTYSGVFADPADRTIDAVLGRADAKCMAAAKAAVLGGVWRAFLRGSSGATTVEPEAHAGANAGPYVDVDGNVVFAQASVKTMSNAVAVNRTETGRLLPSTERVWVGASAEDCSSLVDGTNLSWTGATSSAQCGDPTNRTLWFGAVSLPCNGSAHLYCFEQ